MYSEKRSAGLKISISPKVNFSLLVVLCSCICMWIQFYALPYKQSSLFSLANRLLLVLWIVVVGVAIFRRMLTPISGETVNVVMIVVCTAVSWMYAAVNNPGSTVDNALKMAGFWMLPVMLCYSGFFRMDPRSRTIVFAAFLLSALLFIRLYHSDLCHQYQGPYAIVQIDAVTLGYDNPNQTAIYTFLCCIGLFSGMYYFNSKYMRILCAVVGCYIAWIMLQTDSRTTKLMMAAFVIMAFYVRKREIPRLWVHIAYLLPLGYLLLSLVLPLLGENITIFGETIFTGREEIYDRYFQRLNVMTFFFGDMNAFKFQNLHNGYIAVAASAGVIVCLNCIMLLRTALLRNRPGPNAPVYERIAFVGVLCAVMNMSSEAALLVGGSHYAFLLFCLIVLFVKPRITPGL